MKILTGTLREKFLQIVLIAGLSAFSVSASANLITGDLAYGGIATETDGTLNFLNPVSAIGTGDLLGITVVSLSPIVIPEAGDALTPSTIWMDALNPLNYFTLESGLRTDDGSGSVTLAGLGTVILDGFDPTQFSWSLSYDTADNFFFFSASQVSAVPEPATLALFGAGLLGLGLSRRRRKQPV